MVAGIRRALSEVERLATSTPSPTFPRIWNIPYPRNPFFTGRDELPTQLAIALKTDQAKNLSQAQAISGLGGIGKTQIAVEYAYRHGHEYECVFWLRGVTHDILVSDFVAIADLI